MSASSGNAPLNSPALAEAAAAWCDRLADDNVPDDVRAEFARWVDGSAARRKAYDAALHAWQTARFHAQNPEILALRHETALRLTRAAHTKRRGTHRLAAAAAGLALLSGLAWLGYSQRLPGNLFSARPAGAYVTQTGERLSSRLPDGSEVTLNTSTRLTTSFTAEERRVELTEGQAFFQVAPDKSRPFAVYAHGRRFVALGTAFDVRVDAGRVQVTMVEGTVRVERQAAEAGTSSAARASAVPSDDRVVAVLTAGQQLTADHSSEDRVAAADARRVTSWRIGQVIFEDSSLEAAVAEVNRYSRIQIQLADPALAQLRISGAFGTGDPNLFVEALTTYFSIAVRSTSGERIVLAAASR